MNQDQARAYAILENAKAVLTGGHFVYNAGDHGNAYINKDAVYLRPKDVSELCRMIAEHFKHEDIEAVLAPAMGALMLSTWTAYHLNQITGKEVISTYADKNRDDGFEVRRGYNVTIKGKKTLIVEDIINSGKSARQAVAAARDVGANVVGLGALCNRGDSTAETLHVPELFSLFNVKLDKYPADDCPLCRDGVAINTNLGHGAKFLAEQSAKA